MSFSAEEAKLPDAMEEAIEWLVLLRGNNLSEAQTHAFADWLSRDALHADAFAKAEDFFNDMVIAAKLPRPSIAEPINTDNQTRETQNKLIPAKVRPFDKPTIHYEQNQPSTVHPELVERPVPLTVRPEPVEGRVQGLPSKPSQSLPSQTNWRWLALPLALAAAWLFAVGLVLPSQSHFLDRFLSDYHTKTGELRDIQLADGSHLLLDTNTAVSVDYQPAKRQITLHHGQVRFTVAKDARRPFEVKADALIVRALGTVFEVYRQASDSISVTVQEHAVAARIQDKNQQVKKGQPIQLEVQAGQQLIYGGDGTLHPPTTVNLAQASAWQKRRLLINDRPLGELLAELGRYRVGRIFLSDAQLNNLRVTGVFPLDNPDEVLASVREVLGLQETRLGLWWVLLHR